MKQTRNTPSLTALTASVSVKFLTSSTSNSFLFFPVRFPEGLQA